MKKSLLLLSFVLAGCFGVLAQMPNGSTAPNFTVVDINGNSHNLYSLLDQGKTVYLDFFATWCSPCWNYMLCVTFGNNTALPAPMRRSSS
jgi:thiol-disulfide isomerase/thioredoxin